MHPSGPNYGSSSATVVVVVQSLKETTRVQLLICSMDECKGIWTVVKGFAAFASVKGFAAWANVKGFAAWASVKGFGQV